MAYYIIRKLRVLGYVVFKVADKSSDVKRSTSLSKLRSRYNYLYLEELIPRACISSYSRYINRFMDEREFVDAMKELINGCPAVLEKGRVMVRVLRFVREPAFEEFRSRSPVIASNGRSIIDKMLSSKKMLSSLKATYIGYYDGVDWYFYAFKEYFCIYNKSNDTLRALYDADKLDPEAVASLTRETVDLLKHVTLTLTIKKHLQKSKYARRANEVCKQILRLHREK
jgi:hypothetical protein